MLLDIRRILSPKGQLWISCPNSQSWLRNMFGRYWINWHVPFHISQFSPQTVTALMEQAGFTKSEIRQGPPPLCGALSVMPESVSMKGHHPPTPGHTQALHALSCLIC